MGEENSAVTRQLQRLQTLLHRIVYHSSYKGKHMNPYWGQGQVLSILAVQPELSQKELGGMLGMSKQSLAELLVKMEKSGYISRGPSEQDKRVVIIHLMDEGRKAISNIEDKSALVSQIFDCLNPEETKQFGEYLERLIKRCSDYFPGEDLAERNQRMERFLAKYDYSFTRLDPPHHCHADGHTWCAWKEPEGEGDKEKEKNT